MSHNTKDFEEKKQAILDIAHKLFCVDGYDQTSVNTIIEKAGISKGTFYHYFSAKEDLMSCLTKRLCHYKKPDIEAIYTNDSLDAQTKLHQLFNAGQDWQKKNNAFLKTLLLVIGNDENLVFRYKMHVQMMETLHPAFVFIIEQGIREGTFTTPSPEHTSKMIVNLLLHMRINVAKSFARAHIDPDVKTQVAQEIKMLEYAIERLLDMPQGTLHIFDETFLFQLFNKETTQS